MDEYWKPKNGRIVKTVCDTARDKEESSRSPGCYKSEPGWKSDEQIEKEMDAAEAEKSARCRCSVRCFFGCPTGRQSTSK